MPVGECERGKDHLSIPKMIIRFDQVNAAQCMITLPIQPGANQVSLISEDQDGVTVERQMQRPAISRWSHFVGFPNLFAGDRIEANQAATHFAGKHMLAQDQRHAGVAQDAERQRFRLRPEDGRGRLVVIELKHQPAHQQPVTEAHRSRHRVIFARDEFLPPPGLACGGIERGHSFWRPDDQLSFPADVDDEGRTESMRRIMERAPDLLARALVESDDTCVWLATDEDDQKVAFDQRAGRELGEFLQLVVLAKMPFSDQLTLARIETQQMACRSQSEHATVLGDGCWTRPGRVLWIERRVQIDFIGESPERLSGFLIKTVNAFPRLGLLGYGVGDKDAATSDDGTGVARSNRRAPPNLQSLSRECLQKAGFVPDTVAVRSAELRPIRCPHRQAQHQGEGSRSLKRDSTIHVQGDE